MTGDEPRSDGPANRARGDSRSDSEIPLLRRVRTDGHGSEEQQWQHNVRLRASETTFRGSVTYVGGAESDRIRTELASVTRDLLWWAASRQRKQDPATVEREADRAA